MPFYGKNGPNFNKVGKGHILPLSVTKHCTCSLFDLSLLQYERKFDLAFEICVLKVKLQRYHAYVPWHVVKTSGAFAKRIWMLNFILFVRDTEKTCEIVDD